MALMMAISMSLAACSNADNEGDASRDQPQRSDAEQPLVSNGPTIGAPSDEGNDGFFVEAEGHAAPEDLADASGPQASESSGEEPSGALVEVEGDRRLENNTFEFYGVRSFVETERDPLSTFALDVDTASYSITRQWLDSNTLPPFESVRVEEFVNSFDYDYPVPDNGLTVVADAGPSPFDEDRVILRLGVQAEQVANRDRPDAALTFVVDTSGSMDRDNRIELVKTALTRLVNELEGGDQVSIVTFGRSGEVLLEPTSVRDRDEILDAIDSLHTGGSTDLESGLRLGYGLADDGFARNGINRVILLSDGVANVGLTDPAGLVGLIRDDADRGIQLVSVGVGMGNYNDVLMETLADDGDGFYAYVNNQAEAEHLFSDDLVSTLLTVAIDSKIQVEFDESSVAAYRLLGFENRAVLDDDFRNDAVDAGELGAGHQVTALYELELRDGVGSRDRIGTAALRWEDPDTGAVIETRLEITGSVIDDVWADTSDDFRLAVTVGAFAEILRESQFAGDVSLAQVADEAERLADHSSDIAELVELVRRADDLR